jgi:ferredoxin
MHEQPRSLETSAVEAKSPNVESAAARLTVTFLRADLVAHWDPSAHSLLDLAEHSGLSPTFCCRAGVCGTCLCKIRRGTVAYFESPVFEPGPGEILLCCSRPTESVDIDI